MSGLFSSSSAKKRNAGFIGDAEDQIAELRAEIAALAKVLSQRGSDASDDARSRVSDVSRSVRSRAHDVRDQAETSIQDLIDNGEALISELRNRYSDTEKQVRQTVKQHPFATIGAAAALGVLVAALIRR